MSRLSPQMLGTRAARSCRTDDFHETPRIAVEALLSVEPFSGPVWEPACGRGAISEVLIEHGHDVISTDLVDRGYGTSGVDFLLEWQPLAPNAVTNPPYKLAQKFAQHALGLTTGKVALLLRLAWLEGKARHRFFVTHRPARVWVFSTRLPMMHREGWTGRKASSAIPHAWFVWDQDHSGATIVDWLQPVAGASLSPTVGKARALYCGRGREPPRAPLGDHRLSEAIQPSLAL